MEWRFNIVGSLGAGSAGGARIFKVFGRETMVARMPRKAPQSPKQAYHRRVYAAVENEWNLLTAAERATWVSGKKPAYLSLRDYFGRCNWWAVGYHDRVLKTHPGVLRFAPVKTPFAGSVAIAADTSIILGGAQRTVFRTGVCVGGFRRSGIANAATPAAAHAAASALARATAWTSFFPTTGFHGSRIFKAGAIYQANVSHNRASFFYDAEEFCHLLRAGGAVAVVPGSGGFLQGHPGIGTWETPAGFGTFDVPESAVGNWPANVTLEHTDVGNWQDLPVPPADNKQRGWMLNGAVLTATGRG